MGQAGLDVSHNDLDRSQLNFAVDDEEEKGVFDFDTSDDENEIKFEYDIQTNNVEELRNIIRKLQSEKDSMEERLRNRCEGYRERIISVERENKKLNNNMKRHTKEKIQRLEGQKNDLEEKIKTMSVRTKSENESSIKKLSLRQRAIEGEIRRSRQRSIQSTKSRSKRSRIIKEFFFTEKNYVDCLVTLKTEYIRPLSQNKNIMSPKIFESMSIFKCFETIFRLNHQFLSRLEETVFLQERDEALVELVIEFCDSFKLYSEYIKRFAQCQRIFNEQLEKNKKLVKFLDETAASLKAKIIKTEDNPGRGGKDLNMGGLLITPIQRLPRYLLLLKDLLKSTKKNSKQYLKLEAVITKLESTIHYCNKKSEEYDDTLKLIELSKKLDITLIQKTLLLDQRIHRVNKYKKYRPCLLYLFNDLLVVHQLKSNVLLNSFRGVQRTLGRAKGGSRANQVTPQSGTTKQWNIYFLDPRGETKGGLRYLGRIQKRKRKNSNITRRQLPPRPGISPPSSPIKRITEFPSPNASSSLPPQDKLIKKSLPTRANLIKTTGSRNTVRQSSHGRSRSNSAPGSEQDSSSEEDKLIEERLTLVARVNGYQNEMRIVWNNVKELNEFVNQINRLRREKRLPEFRIRQK